MRKRLHHDIGRESQGSPECRIMLDWRLADALRGWNGWYILVGNIEETSLNAASQWYCTEKWISSLEIVW